MKKQNDRENENLLIHIDKDNSLIEERDDFASIAPSLEVENDEKITMDEERGYILQQTYSEKSFKRKRERNQQGKRHKKKSNLKGWKKVAIVFLCVIVGMAVITAGTFGIFYMIGKNSLLDRSAMKLTPPKGVSVIDNGNYINYKGHLYRYKESMTSILFMGVDKTYEESKIKNVIGQGGQADALYLAAIDTDNGLTTTFQISRGTMCDIDLYSISGDYIGTANAQVCLAHSYGDGKETSAENVVRAVRRIFFGLPVGQSYASIDIDGISTLNDAIGGVTVTSPVDYIDDNNNKVYEAGKSYELTGEAAENFVRSRSLLRVDANTNRMARQKAYLDAFIDKTISMTKESFSTPINLYNTASPYMTTDISVSKVSYLATDLIRKGITGADIEKIPGKDKMGKEFAEYYIDKTKFFDMIVNTFYVQAD